MKKQQVVLIHGGEAWASREEYLQYLQQYEIDDPNLELEPPKKWKNSLAENLGEDFLLILPRMPSAQNARYEEWKLWFEKYIPFLRDGVILIGNSLGGIFLAKYLSENIFPRKIKSLHLLAAPFGDRSCLKGTTFVFRDFPGKLPVQVENTHLYHSRDDSIVDFGDFLAYAEALPQAEKHIFENYDHFFIEDFPELERQIKKDVS